MTQFAMEHPLVTLAIVYLTYLLIEGCHSRMVQQKLKLAELNSKGTEKP